MTDQKRNSRREFLAGSAVVGAALAVPSPIERVLEAISTGWIHRAQAEASGNAGSRNYINLLMAGAPSRYVFDHWMRTNPSDMAIDFNPMVTNKFISSGGRAVGLENATFNYKGVLVPHMFSHNVYNGTGGQRPLTDLLNHMMVIRGYGTGFDGHPFNACVQQAPVGGVSSIMGLAADYSTKTFEAVEWPDRATYGSYSSSKGKALNKVNGAPLHNLLEGFGGPQGGRIKGRSLKDRNREAYDLAQARMRAYASSDHAGSSIIAKNLANATEMMKKGVSNIDSYWGPAVARYNAVIVNSMRQSGLAGISDSAIISDQGNMWGVFTAEKNGRLTVSANFDMRQAIANVTAPAFLAEGLALAEYVLKEKLVTTLNLQVGDLNNVLLREAISEAFLAQTMVKDMHETGAMPSVLLNTCYYRGIAAGLLELSDRLKATSVNGTNMWSETVVQITSDFGRSARSNGSGSDHGFNQMVTSVYSGAIKQPLVVGNIRRAGHGGGYEGTQGIGAAIDGYTQAGMPTPTMAASTVAAILRVDHNPYQNLAAPLVQVTGDQVAALKLAKVV